MGQLHPGKRSELHLKTSSAEVIFNFCSINFAMTQSQGVCLLGCLGAQLLAVNDLGMEFSNSVGERCALLSALLFLEVIQHQCRSDCVVHVFSDSEVALHTILGSGFSESNPEMTNIARTLREEAWTINHTHVYGHSGNVWNEAADKAAAWFMESGMACWDNDLLKTRRRY